MEEPALYVALAVVEVADRDRGASELSIPRRARARAKRGGTVSSLTPWSKSVANLVSFPSLSILPNLCGRTHRQPVMGCQQFPEYCRIQRLPGPQCQRPIYKNQFRLGYEHHLHRQHGAKRSNVLLRGHRGR